MGLSEAAVQARRDYLREWRRANRERVNKYQNEWRKKNPGKAKEYVNRYWEKQAGLLETKEEEVKHD